MEQQQASDYLKEPAATRVIIPSNSIKQDHREAAAAGSCPPEWAAIIREGYSWKRLIEKNVRTDFNWAEIVERQGWGRFLFRPASGPDETFYKRLYCKLVASIEQLGGSQTSEPISLAASLVARDCGAAEKVAARSVRCIQYDDTKMVVGFGDSAIRLWDRERLRWSGTIFRALSCSINCLQYNNDLIIGGCSDSIIRIWDLRRAATAAAAAATRGSCQMVELPVRKLVKHTGSVMNLKLANNTLVSCSADQTVVVWSFQDGARRVHADATLIGHTAEVHQVTFDEHYIVSLSLDGCVKIWQGHNCLRTLALDFGGFGRSNPIVMECLQLHEGLLACGTGRSLQIWDIKSGACVRRLHELEHEVAFKISQQPVSRQYSGLIRVWPNEPAAAAVAAAPESNAAAAAPASGKELQRPAASGPNKAAQIIELSQDEFKLVRCAWDVMMMRQILTSNRIHQLDVVAAPETSRCRLEQTDFVSMLCRRGVFQLAERILLSLDAASFCRAARVCRSWLSIIQEGNLWKRMIDKQLSSSQVWLEVLTRRGLVASAAAAAHQSEKSRSFRPSPRLDASLAALDGSLHERVLVYTTADIEELDERWRTGRPASVRRIETEVFGRWSWADDSIQVAQRDQNRLTVRHRESKQTRTLHGFEGPVLCLQANRLQMIACGTADGSLLIWQPDSDRPARELVGHHAPVRCLKFTDQLLVSGSEDMTLIVWQIRGGAGAGESPANNIGMREILFGHTDEIRAIDFQIHSGADNNCKSKFMASGSLDGNVRVWLLDTLECVHSFATGAGPVQCLQCDRSSLLVAGFKSGAVRIWDLESGNQLRALDSIGRLQRLRFDTKRIVVGNDRGALTIWPIESILDGSLSDSEIQRADLNDSRAFGMLDLRISQTEIRCLTITGLTVIWDFLNQGI